MRTPLLIVLLVVNLLTCPLRCFSCPTNSASDESAAPAACRCCYAADSEALSPVSEFDSEQNGTSPCGDDCNCNGCICEGAVLVADWELPSSELNVQWAARLDVRSFCPSIADSNFQLRPDLPLRASLSGRQVRVAHQSWLI